MALPVRSLLPSFAALSTASDGPAPPSSPPVGELVIQTLHISPSRVLVDSLESNLKASRGLFERLEQLQDGEPRDHLIAELGKLNEEMSGYVDKFLVDSKQNAAAATINDHPRAAQEAGPSEAPQKVTPSDIVHEFRSPLNNILGALGAGMDPALQISILKSSYEHLQCLVTNGTVLKLKKDTFTIGDLVLQVRALTSQIDPRVSIDFGRLDQLPNVSLIGDVTKIKQILVNLISNAVKYSPKPGGVVTVSFDARENQDEQMVIRFGVRDQGPGIPKDLQSQLFKRYAQLSAQPTDATQKKSSGLGLALSQVYVKFMGGRDGIQIVSHPELGQEGTLFYFDLPLDKQLSLVEPLLSPKLKGRELPPMAGDSFNILIADDDRRALQIFRKAYENYKGDELFTVQVVGNGKQAVQACTQKKYEVIILDMRMPDQEDGWKAAKAILMMANKAFPPQFIFCTGDAERPADLDSVPGAIFFRKPAPMKEVVALTIKLGQQALAAQARSSN